MYSLGLDWEAVDFFSFIADMAGGDQDLQIMYGIGGERELEEFELDHLPGLRELPSGAHRQRGVLAAPARRLGRPARLGVPALEGGRPPRQPDLADPRRRSARRSSTGASRTPASGRCAASRSTSRRRRSCAGSRSTAARRSPGWAATDDKAAEWELAADEIKQDILDNGVDERGVLTQYYGSTSSTRRCCWPRCCASCRPTTRGSGRR